MRLFAWSVALLWVAALAQSDPARERFDAAVRAQKSGDLTAAAAGYRELLQQNPKLTVARHLLAVCELQSGHVPEGIRQLEIVRRDEPSNRQAIYTLASAYISVGRLEEVQAIVDKDLRRDATAPGKLIRGSFAMARGDYEAAVAELQAARRVNKSLPGLTSQLGIAYCFANRLDEAVPLLEEALRENPADGNAAAFLGWLYKDRDRHAEAAALLERTVRDRPSDRGALFLLAQLKQARGDATGAVAMLEEVVRGEPSHRAAHVLLARLYKQLNRPEDAARERAIVDRLTAEQQAAQPAVP